jgi:hypothetical protein
MERTHRDPDGHFLFRAPEEWEVERDEEGGVLVSRPEGAGMLHLIHFDREGDEEADPGEELYAFLEEQEIELEEDEVEDLELPTGSLALCEYLEEDEDETVFWLIGVATAPGGLVFASYSCPAGEEAEEKGIVRALLATLELTGAHGAP